MYEFKYLRDENPLRFLAAMQIRETWYSEEQIKNKTKKKKK